MTPREDGPALVSIVALDGRDEQALLALAAGVASGLEPALGTAIVKSARERDVAIAAVDGFQETAGAGVVASIGGRRVVVGNALLFARLGLSVEGLGDWPARLRRHGQQVVFVAVDGRIAGFLGLTRSGV